LGWLGHSDARQAFDLPELRLFLHAVFDQVPFCGHRPGFALRQVGDLPRINVAKPPKSDVKILKLKN